MDNKGQTLIIFVLILPILLLLFTLIWEIGNLSFTINKYEAEIKDTINYGLKNKENIDENTLINLLKENIDGNITVKIDDKIKIDVKEKYKALFKFNNHFYIDITYIGYIENEKIIIKRIEG